MKERFEVVSCEKKEQAVRNEPLRCPIKNGCDKGRREEDRGKISRQSSCVFHDIRNTGLKPVRPAELYSAKQHRTKCPAATQARCLCSGTLLM
jgi:hypothetical protein